MFFVIFLIVIGGLITPFLIIFFITKLIKKLRLKTLQRNNQINQPDIVIVNNEAQPNIETNQNENQNIQKNVNAPEKNIDTQRNQNQNEIGARITNLQNTEGEVIPFSDNLESKQNDIKAWRKKLIIQEIKNNKNSLEINYYYLVYTKID